MSAKYEISRPQILAIILFCFILIGLNLFLLIQNRQLKLLMQSDRESSITVGTKIFPLRGFDVSGNEIEVNPAAEKKTLVLVFSSTCRFCDQNASNWREILQTAKFAEINIVGVALGRNGEAFLKKHKLESQFSMVNLVPDELIQLPTFDVTPQTILLDSGGKAEKVWSGVLDKKRLSEVLDTVGAVKAAV